jgi:hypothetical protein
VTAADIKLMAWARNYMHDEGAVHCDEWEDFFNIHNELANPKNWSVKGRHKTINWDVFLQQLVLANFFNVDHCTCTCGVFGSFFNSYTVTILYSPLCHLYWQGRLHLFLQPWVPPLSGLIQDSKNSRLWEVCTDQEVEPSFCAIAVTHCSDQYVLLLPTLICSFIHNTTC